MANKRVCVFLLLNLVINAFSVPMPLRRKREISDDEMQNEIQGNEDTSTALVMEDLFPESSKPEEVSSGPVDSLEFDDDDIEDDDDFDFEPTTSSNTSGSNIFALFNLLQGMFTSSNGNQRTRDIIRKYLHNNANKTITRKRTTRSIDKNDKALNLITNHQNNTNQTIKIDEIIIKKDKTINKSNHTKGKKVTKPKDKIKNPSKTKLSIEASETIEDFSDEYDDDYDEESDETNSENGKEPTNDSENGKEPTNDSENGKEPTNDAGDENGNGDASVSDEDDYEDDFGGEDGQGGGVLGILAGLSGENGESDLGALLATVSGILASLSGGDDFDLNSIIAAGVGLLVGLLSEGNQNPGTVIANYFLTSIDSITGGGSNNNGAFFGSFVSRLLRGISAYRDPDGESDENAEETKDSSGFLKSLLMSLLGEMSAGSSASSSSSHQCCGD